MRDLLEQENKNYNRGYRDFDIVSEAEANSLETLFCGSIRQTKAMPLEDFHGMSLSSSKVKPIIDRIGTGEYKEKLNRLFQAFQNDKGCVDVIYNSEVYIFKPKIS